MFEAPWLGRVIWCREKKTVCEGFEHKAMKIKENRKSSDVFYLGSFRG
jgi:hypothetical protein